MSQGPKSYVAPRPPHSHPLYSSLISDHIALYLNTEKNIIMSFKIANDHLGTLYQIRVALSKAIHRAFVLFRGSHCAEREDGKRID